MASLIPRDKLLSVKPKAHVDAVWFTFFSLVTVTILFRFYGRRFVMKAWGADDWISLFAYLVLISFVIVEHVRLDRFYENVDFLLIPQPLPAVIAGIIERYEAGGALHLSAIALGNWSIGPAKVSILFLFLRIVSRPLHRYVLWTFATVIMVWTVIITVLPFFERIPFAYLQHPITYVGPKRDLIDIGILLQIGIAAQLAFDSIIMLLPIPLLVSLNVQRRVKIGLYAVYAIGFLSLATTIVRLLKTVNFARAQKQKTAFAVDEAVLEYPELSLWLAIETCTVFICANMPGIIASWKRKRRTKAANATVTNTRKSKLSSLLTKLSLRSNKAEVDSSGSNLDVSSPSLGSLPPVPVSTMSQERMGTITEKYKFDENLPRYKQQDLEEGRESYN